MVALMPSAQQVAVVGAGAAGLVASRHLLRCGFRPCLFDSASCLGGAWAAATTTNVHDNYNDRTNKMWEGMHTNLSKHTCCFSDFPHSSSSSSTSSSRGGLFASRAEMQHYLESYAATHVLNNQECTLKLGCTVTKIRRNKTNQRYRVEWTTTNTKHNEKRATTAASTTTTTTTTTQSQEFDGVVVATGFFSTPVVVPPPHQQPPCNHNQRNNNPIIGRMMMHSSQYRSADDFAIKDHHQQTVAVCGASFSALEIAADVATRAKRVISILPHIPWVVPRYVPTSKHNSNNHAFLPVDWVLYQRQSDAPQQVPAAAAAQLVMDREACRAKHLKLKSLLGTRKQSAIGIPNEEEPPLIAISDDYLDLVRDGTIQVHHGRLVNTYNNNDANDANDNNNAMIIELDTGEVLEGIDAVILGTGYRPNLNFLDSDILELLDHDDADTFAPLTLAYDALHPDLPRMGFVGMYRGPYFGAMELQARLVAEHMSGRLSDVDNDDNVLRTALRDAQTIRQHRPRAQFPRWDYIGFMDSMASLLNLVPPRDLGGAKGDVVIPAFYQPSKELAEEAMRGVNNHVRAAENGANMPRVFLSAIVGAWSFDRTMTHFSSSSSSSSSLTMERRDHVTGTIRFSKRKDGASVLYREDGIFHMPSGDMQVFREYHYVVNEEDDDTLEVYFVEGGERAHLFLSLKFQKKDDGRFWEATSDHLCIKDLYRGTFQVAFDGIAASEIIMSYRVKGPSKDYEAVTKLVPV